MPYTAEKPRLVPSSEELRQRIPGWGVDLDPRDRPGIPRENFNPQATGAHWDFPERQPENWPRERSTEHKFLTPVFGTSCPPRGISGVIRKYAYQFSEGRMRHWLLLAAADRVDVIENRLEGLVTGRPDNPITESGILSEFKGEGMGSRFGQHRTDLKSHAVDVVMFAGICAAVVGVAYGLTRGAAEGVERGRRMMR